MFLTQHSSRPNVSRQSAALERPVLYGNKAFDATLQLEFLGDDKAIKGVVQNWYDSMGSYLPVSLPDTVYAGQSNLLGAVTPDYLEWHWEKEPTITSVQPNLSRVQVNLIAHLEI